MRTEPPLALTVALAVVLALAAAGLALGVVLSVVEPKPVVGFGLRVTQRQGAESALYVISFAIAMPAAAVLAPRLLRAVWERHGPSAGPAVALLATGLMVAAGLTRLAGKLDAGGGPTTFLVLMLVWWALAAVLILPVTRARAWAPLAALAGRERAAWLVTAAAVVVGTALVAHTASVSIAGLVVIAAGAALLVAAHDRLPRLPGRALVMAEVIAAVAITLAIPDLVVITPENPATSAGQRILDAVIQFHADFLIGPANQVLGGSAMLAPTSSQYGVGSIYSLDAWFQIVPIGYGSLSLYDGVTTAACFAAGFATIRLAGVRRGLALGTFAAAVALLVLNREYPVGTLLQEGPLRFGMPVPLILAAVVAARGGRWRRPAEIAVLVVLGLASIWAAEAFVYTTVTYAAIVVLEAILAPAGAWRRLLIRRLAGAAGAVVIAHVAFAAATLAATGDLPAWHLYLSLIKAFLLDQLGEITYDFSPWSPGLAVGAAYLAEGTALLALVLTRRDLVRGRRPAFVALTGLTAYGILIFSYFVNRSADHVLPYVTTPALLAGAVWLSLVPRRGFAARAATGFALALLLVPGAVAWSTVRGSFDHSLAGHLVPGGASTGQAIDRLRDFPPIDARATQGERVLNRFFPGRDRVPVVMAPALSTEVLVRSRRSNKLEIADAVGESYVPQPRMPIVRDAVNDLKSGDLVLLDQGALAALRALRARPRYEPAQGALQGAPTERIQTYALALIQRRFRVPPVFADRQGFVVARLTARR